VAATEVRREWNRLIRMPRATPLEVAANIAVFLQTLDDDGDPSNGIRIPAAIHGLAAGVSIDFGRKSFGSEGSEGEAFANDFALRKLIADGRAAGLWGGSRAIRGVAQAFDALYARLGLTPSVQSVDFQTTDSDADGTVDKTHAYTYDADGRVTVSEDDNDADGMPEYRYTYTYDANGNRTMEEQDFGADGTIEYRSTFAYDANGNWTMEEQDDGADGTIEYRNTYAYDANGNRTMFEYDEGADGTIEYRSTFAYDANGNRTMEDRDDGADGTIEYRYTYAYDANGNLTMFESDQGADGTVDYRLTYTHTPLNLWAALFYFVYFN